MEHVGDYMLIDLTTGNAQGFYATESEALADVAQDVRANGRGYAQDLALVAPAHRYKLSGGALVDKALGLSRKTA